MQITPGHVLPDLDPAVARLVDVAQQMDEVDRRQAQLLVALAELVRDRTIRRHVDVPDEVWAAGASRLRRVDARAMVRTAHTLSRMPLTLRCLREGWVSTSQAAQIATAARAVRVGVRHELDRLVADLAIEQTAWAPDDLIVAVWERADELQPSLLEKEEAAATEREFLTLIPRLHGGGTVHGELGPETFAVAAEAFHAPVAAPTVDAAELIELSDAELADVMDEFDQRRRKLGAAQGAAMAERFREVCGQIVAGRRGDGADGDFATAPARPMAYLAIGAESLLDPDGPVPGELLHTLAGGRMKVSASFARELVDRRGADLRTIVLDEVGEVVGVGRRTRIPPWWLREAIWVRDRRDRSAHGHTPVRRCDVDHVDPWRPDAPGSRPGVTDVNNLHALGRAGHTGKTSDRWRVDRTQDGTTTWVHTVTGFTVTHPPPHRGPP